MPKSEGQKLKLLYLADLLRRPRITYEELAPFDPERPPLPREIVREVEITIKYQGYIDRQLRQVAEMKKLEELWQTGRAPWKIWKD